MLVERLQNDGRARAHVRGDADVANEVFERARAGDAHEQHVGGVTRDRVARFDRVEVLAQLGGVVRLRGLERRDLDESRERAPGRFGVIYFGSTSAAMTEAEALLEERGVGVDLCRLRGYPFADEVASFIGAHEQVFVVEQNRDAQMRTLLIKELEVDPARLVPVLHYDGTPITARFIAGEIGSRIDGGKVTPIDRRASVA